MTQRLRSSGARSRLNRPDEVEARVSPLELFFDLVFVFALTQVTAFLASHLTWVGVLQGAALLAAFVAFETLYWLEDRGKLRAH